MLCFKSFQSLILLMYLYELSTYPKQLTCNVISWPLMIFIVDWWVWFATNFGFRKLEPMHMEVNLADSRHAYSYVHMQKKLHCKR